jgi:hypothetical protein
MTIANVSDDVNDAAVDDFPAKFSRQNFLSFDQGTML